MGRVGTFVLGFLFGGAAVWWSLHYHVVRANDGLHPIPKVTSTFSELYVDIRSFGLEEWNQHRELAFALTKANKAHLMHGFDTGAFEKAVNGVIENAFDRMGGSPPPTR
jgi:hypothetical protein